MNKREGRVQKLKANQESLFFTEEKPEKSLNLETGKKKKRKILYKESECSSL